MSDGYQSAFPEDAEGQLDEQTRDERDAEQRREDADEAGVENAIENSAVRPE